MEPSNLNRTNDGETLRRLASGLEIIRRRKHEYSDTLATLTSAELREATDKRAGSKFNSTWSLEQYVDSIEQQVAHLGWSLQPGSPSSAVVSMDRTIGWVRGQSVSTIRIVCDGRYVHAYPVED